MFFKIKQKLSAHMSNGDPPNA